MFYERVIEIIVFLLAEMKSNKELNEVDVHRLTKLGYTQSEINTAFSWIYSKFNPMEKALRRVEQQPRSHRFLHEIEKNVISTEGYGYLIQLRELGMINDLDIEAIIERVMSSGYFKASKDDIKYFLAGYLLDLDETSGSRHIMINSNDTIN